LLVDAISSIRSRATAGVTALGMTSASGGLIDPASWNFVASTRGAG
jgi:hypothetical protein